MANWRKNSRKDIVMVDVDGSRQKLDLLTKAKILLKPTVAPAEQ